MNKTFGIAFSIGAALSGTFKSSISGAGAQIKRLGADVRKFEAGGKKIERFRALQAQIERTGDDLVRMRKRAAAVKAELNRTAKPTKKLKAEMAAAGKAVARTEQRLADQRRTLGALRGQLAAVGVNTRSLSGEQDRLARSLERSKRAQDRLNAAVMRGRKVRQDRARRRGQLTDAVALGASVAAPAVSGAKNEELRLYLGTVINAKDKAAAVAAANDMARAMANAGVSTFADAFNIQYALNSAGLAADASRLGAPIVAKVSRLTRGVPESVGEVIATTYNNLGKQLSGSAGDRLNRIGELLTKAQFRFQLRDFDQLGESMKYGAAGMANYNVELAQGVTLLGQLNSAGLDSTRAGTALNAVLRNLGKAQDAWGTQIVRNASGQLDMIATLEGMRTAMDEMFGDDVDARAGALQKLFGDEGVRGIVPMLDQLEVIKAAYKDVGKGSIGLIDKEYAKFSKSTIGQSKALLGSMTVLGDGIARILLPPARAVMGVIARGAQAVAGLTERFPRLTGAVVGTAGGVAVATAATIAGSYAFTFLRGGLLNVAKVYQILRGSTVAAALAQQALNLAMKMSPIGWVITVVAALAAGAVALYKNWEPFRNLMNSIGRGLKKLAKLAFALSPVGIGLKLVRGIAKGIGKSGGAPAKAMAKSLGKVDELLPHSDAKKGPLSGLTDSGRAMVETMGKGARSAGGGGFGGVLPIGVRSGGGGININYAPNITVGAGENAEQVREAAKEGARESMEKFEAMFNEMMADKERRAFA